MTPTLEQIGMLVAEVRAAAQAFDLARAQHQAALAVIDDTERALRAANEEFTKARGALMCAALPTKEETWPNE